MFLRFYRFFKSREKKEAKVPRILKYESNYQKRPKTALNLICLSKSLIYKNVMRLI
jgi:hypothetical protein